MAAIPPIGAVIIPVTPFQQNCTLLWNTSTMEGVFVDPGGEADRLISEAQKHGVKVKEIWITHGHLDHAGGAMQVAEKLGVQIIGPHIDDKFWCDSIVEAWGKYGVTDCDNCVPDRWLNDGDKLYLGDIAFDVVHTPGHTPGHVVIINKDLELALVGDVLFQGSIGRTDFPKGNHQDLIDSITKKLWPYGDNIRFVPGHGPMSTFGNERQTNPFVADKKFG
ncbi:MAG: hypothetical protein FD163_700 [Hyphomonadaceae bacterium]|nr:MAG: hypothetical protein FD128_1057 [Hyphomonadaceae bacterium]KAF0186032.1 MAG: hypothetical protein FD163_700 [Hyphomonadaceae bacterium]